MAKASAGAGSPSSKPGAAAPPGKSAGGVARHAKAGVKGNGNRSAQVELDLSTDTPRTDAQDGEGQAPRAAGAAAPPAPPPAASPQAAAPAMRELGLTRKEAWKIDLKGKRSALDAAGWREELARALGRNAGKT